MCTVLHILACGKSGGIETLVSEYARESSHDNHFVFVWEDGYYEKKIREAIKVLLDFERYRVLLPSSMKKNHSKSRF